MAQLSETERYIYISPKMKVINPVHNGTLYHYEGSIENYNFRHQQKNYEKLQEILEPYGKRLTYIYVGKFMGERREKVIFMAHNDDRSIWWRKYESVAEGSGQNWVYYEKDGNIKQIKTTMFIDNPENYLE